MAWASSHPAALGGGIVSCPRKKVRKAFAVRPRRVSPTAIGRSQPLFFFNDVEEALAM